MLAINAISVGYGKITAVRELSLDVPKGGIVALLGPNGAGKTTTVRALFGLLPCRSGAVTFQGKPITGMAPHKVIRQGLGLVPQGRELFPGMSVLDNLTLGAYTVGSSRQIRESLERIFRYFPRLAERRTQAAGSLSGGEQQMLALGRALMANPVMLVLDEPSIGLAPLVVRSVFDIIAQINKEEGVSVLVAEQNAHQALRIAHRAYVIETGRVVAAGEPKELLQNDAMKVAYLGAEAAAIGGQRVQA